MKETLPSKHPSLRAMIDESLQTRINQYQHVERVSYLGWFGVMALLVLGGEHLLLNRPRTFFLLVSPGPAWLLHLLQVYQPVSIGIGWVAGIGVIQVSLLPVNLIAFLLRRRARLSTQKVTRWLVHWLQRTVRENLSWLVAIQLCYALLIAQPQTWWLWLPFLFTFCWFCAGAAYLLLLYPLCYHYRTITHPQLLQMLHGLSIDSGSPMPHIKQIARKPLWRKKPTQTRLWLNGYATGWGRMRTIILTDGALRCCPPSEVRCLLAHELGHLVHHDFARKLILFAGILFPAFFLFHLLYAWFLALLKQIVSLGYSLLQPQLFVLLLLILGILGGVFLIQLAYSRHVEYQADEFALCLTNDVASFKSLQIRLLNFKRSSLKVSFFQELAMTHPSPFHRLAHANEFARRQTSSLVVPPLRLSKAAIRRAWNLPPIIATTLTSSGTMHHSTLLSTTTVPYVLRAYRYMEKDRSRIVHEHTVAAYVQARGLPAVAPLPLTSGGTILEHQARFYAVYPIAFGVQIPREQTTAPEIIAAMGRCLATLHQVLADYPQEGLRTPVFAVDPPRILALLERIEAVIAEKTDLDTLDQGVLTRLAQQKIWLETAPRVDLAPFLSIERQVIHGDYQESNLFFADGKVSAIINWEKVCVAARPWETLRVLDYVFDLDATCCQLFLSAYQEVLPISASELAITAQAYGWIHDHNL